MKRIIIIFLSVTACLSACKRIELSDSAYNYKASIDTQYSQLYNIPAPDKGPKQYRILFYDPETEILKASCIVGRDGGSLYNLLPGVYNIVVYNYEHNNTKISYEESSSTIIANSTVIGYDGMPVVNSPDHLYVQTFDEVNVPYLTGNDEAWVLNCKPSSIVESWLLYIDGIKGLENAQIIDCYVTGQADGAYLYPAEVSLTQCSIFFKGETNLEKGVIETPFNTFGKLAEAAAKLQLNLIIEGSGGDTYICKADVTDQFDDPENTEKIIRATFDITIKPRQDSGFNPSAEEWEPEVEIIDLT